MAEKYGADTGRLYTLFAAPPEKDLEWSEESIEGAWRFLNRVYRLVDKHAEAATRHRRRGAEITSRRWHATEKEKGLLRKAHQTLRRVTQDFETRWHFNSAIAQIMELTNAIYAAEPLEENVRPEVRREVLELVTLMLAPMTPHLAEELWEMLGHEDGLVERELAGVQCGTGEGRRGGDCGAGEWESARESEGGGGNRAG